MTRDSHQNLPDNATAVDAGLEQWVAAGQSGDTEALGRVYHQCSPRIYALVRRMAGREHADDLTQQVFLQAFRKLGQFNGRSKFETWLYRLAVNEVLQWGRKRQRKKEAALVADPPQTDVPATVRMEQREMLEWALQQLEPELRAVFLLKEQQGQSYREIAEAVGIPEGTVGSRLNRARQQLRELLAQAGWGA